jgi:hypothetical protein
MYDIIDLLSTFLVVFVARKLFDVKISPASFLNAFILSYVFYRVLT